MRQHNIKPIITAVLCVMVAFTSVADFLGDIDNNRIIDVEDVNAAINIILKLRSTSDYPGDGDMDGNGTIDVEDVNAIINVVLYQGTPSGRKVGMGEGKDSVYMQRILNYGLEVLDIELIDGEWPTTDYVSPPPGAWGRTISNPSKVPGRMRLLLRDSVLYDTGDYIDNESGMTLRIRGNTSAYQRKKPYKIKLQKKADLLHRDSVDGRDKDWLLVYDETLHYMLGFEVGRLVGMTWTPGYRYVNVIINNQYEGIYLLLESVKRNTDCRLNVSKQGYIFEHDQYWWNEPVWLPSTCIYPYRYTFKYPDPEGFTEVDSVYMTALTHEMDLSYSNGNYPEVIDVTSFARFCLVHDIMGTHHYGANRYYIKYDKSDTTLVEMPLMWDFDREDGDPTGWSLTHRAFFYQLFENTNRNFVEEYANQWNKVRDNLYGHTDSLFRDVYNNFGNAIVMSMYLNNKRWDAYYPTYNNFSNRPNWVKKRIPWLDHEISKFTQQNR